MWIMQNFIFKLFPVNFLIWLDHLIYAIGAHILAMITGVFVEDINFFKSNCFYSVEYLPV